ncbi:hypothetical protein Tco_0818525 [Tanacetum coccineum]
MIDWMQFHMMSIFDAVVTSRYPTPPISYRTCQPSSTSYNIMMEKVTVQPYREDTLLWLLEQHRKIHTWCKCRQTRETTDVKLLHCKGEGHIAKQCTKPMRKKRDETWFNDKVLLVQAQAGGQALTEEEIAFLADPRLPDNDANLFKEWIRLQSLSVNNPRYLNYDLFHQVSRSCRLLQQSNDSSQSETAIISCKAISSLSQYLSEIQRNVFRQNSNSSAQQDVLILSMFDQITTQVTHCNTVNKALTTELDRYKEEIKDLKEKQNVENSFSGSNEQFDEIVRLKQNLFEQVQEKDCLMKTVSELKNELKLEENRNIDREIALEKKIKQLDNIIFKRGQSAQTVHMMTKSKICYDHSSKQAIGFEKPFCLYHS